MTLIGVDSGFPASCVGDLACPNANLIATNVNSLSCNGESACVDAFANIIGIAANGGIAVTCTGVNIKIHLYIYLSYIIYIFNIILSIGKCMY